MTSSESIGPAHLEQDSDPIGTTHLSAPGFGDGEEAVSHEDTKAQRSGELLFVSSWLCERHPPYADPRVLNETLPNPKPPDVPERCVASLTDQRSLTLQVMKLSGIAALWSPAAGSILSHGFTPMNTDCAVPQAGAIREDPCESVAANCHWSPLPRK